MRWWQVMHVLTVTILQHRQSNRIMPSILPHRKRVKDLAYPLKLFLLTNCQVPPAVRHALDSLQANATVQSFRRGVANTASTNRRYKSQQDMDVGLYISLFIRPTRSSEDGYETTRETLEI